MNPGYAIDVKETIRGVRNCADGTCRPTTLAPTPATQRSAWKALLWGALAGVLDAILHYAGAVDVPAVVRPFLPLIVGGLRYAVTLLRRAEQGSWTEVRP